MSRGHPQDASGEFGEERLETALRSYYRSFDADSGLSIRVWDSLETRIHETGTPPQRAAQRFLARRRLRVATGVAAGIAAVLGLTAGSFYVAPRWQSYASAMVNGSAAPSGQLQSALGDDPGLLGAFRRGAFQPLHLSATANGVTLTLLDFYTDASRTVIVYHITGPSAPPGALVVEPWQISLSNFEQTSEDTLLGKPVPKLRSFSVSLRDQFGLDHHWTAASSGGNGYGYLEFAPIARFEQALGLRLTLHVQAMQTVRAEGGVFGPRQYLYETGPWNISFVALPAKTPSLTMTPNTSTSADGVLFTLNSVHSSGSETRLVVTSQGLARVSGQAGSPTFSVTAPDGRKVSFVDSTQSGSRFEVQFPPLVEAGTYRLNIRSGSKRWQVLWSQPKWSGQTAALTPPGTSLPLYAGPDLAAARKLVDFPVYLPPTGWRVQKVEVSDNNGPVLSGSRQSTPRNLTLWLQGPRGERVLVIQSRALLSLMPPSQSYQAFVNGLAQSTHHSVQSVQRMELAGMQAMAVQLEASGEAEQKQSLSALAVYPAWGSVEIDAIPGAHAPTQSQLLQFAHLLLAQPAAPAAVAGK